MKLYTRLLYILLAVFITGVAVVCFADTPSVWSRIATGLITGSFVGLVNALTNYIYTRQMYFEKMVMSLMDVRRNLCDDLVHAKARNMFIADMSKEKMIAYSAEHEDVMKKIEEADKMKDRYEKLASQFDFEAYQPLIPWTSRGLTGTLEELENLISFDIVNLHSDYQTCYSFSLLSSPASEEEQRIVLGDSDEFFDFVVKENRDYEDLLVYYLDRFATQASSLSSETGRYMSKMYRGLLVKIPVMTRMYIKDAVVRNVIEERAREAMNEDVE